MRKLGRSDKEGGLSIGQLWNRLSNVFLKPFVHSLLIEIGLLNPTTWTCKMLQWAVLIQQAGM